MNGWSLFTGIGGFDEGLRRAGIRITFQCEADEYRRAVLAARFVGVDCATDVRDVGGAQGARRASFICGGFPCQDLSVAGRRAGLNGSRSSLFFEFARVADLVLPPGGWLLLENVPGLLSSNGGRDYAVVLATLAKLGFHDLAWRVLDSRHFGVAQRRRRVYILARRARGSRACEVLLEPEGSAGHLETRGEAGQGVAVASLSGLGSDGPDDNDGQAGRLVSSTLMSSKTSGWRANPDHEVFIADTLTSGSHPESNMPGRRREDDTNIVPAVFNWQTGGDFRLGYSEEGPTALQREQTPAAITAAGVRRLTPRECERLQGFPDDWTLIPGASDSKRYAALGDAVTVPVAEWIGRRLLEVAT